MVSSQINQLEEINMAKIIIQNKLGKLGTLGKLSMLGYSNWLGSLGNLGNLGMLNTNLKTNACPRKSDGNNCKTN